MRYRDLLPSRQGGRFIASHITIPDAGPVPDYVHHHDVRFQFIYCLPGLGARRLRGPGRAVRAARPATACCSRRGIRHRVLESSAGLEVLEVTEPGRAPDVRRPRPVVADAPTSVPSGPSAARRSCATAPRRRVGAVAAAGVRGRATAASARPPTVSATCAGPGRPPAAQRTAWGRHDAELRLWFVTAGAATLRVDGRPEVHLGADDAVAVPAGVDHALVACSDDFELLEVTFPAIP